MHRALLAGGLFFAKYALIQPLVGIAVERLIVFGVVAGIRAAALVERNHAANGLFFPRNTFARHRLFPPIKMHS